MIENASIITLLIALYWGARKPKVVTALFEYTSGNPAAMR
jgi:hypothetical protein